MVYLWLREFQFSVPFLLRVGRVILDACGAGWRGQLPSSSQSVDRFVSSRGQ